MKVFETFLKKLRELPEDKQTEIYEEALKQFPPDEKNKTNLPPTRKSFEKKLEKLSDERRAEQAKALGLRAEVNWDIITKKHFIEVDKANERKSEKDLEKAA